LGSLIPAAYQRTMTWPKHFYLPSRSHEEQRVRQFSGRQKKETAHLTAGKAGSYKGAKLPETTFQEISRKIFLKFFQQLKRLQEKFDHFPKQFLSKTRNTSDSVDANRDKCVVPDVTRKYRNTHATSLKVTHGQTLQQMAQMKGLSPLSNFST